MSRNLKPSKIAFVAHTFVCTTCFYQMTESIVLCPEGKKLLPREVDTMDKLYALLNNDAIQKQADSLYSRENGISNPA